jgi:hypothetical protein
VIAGIEDHRASLLTARRRDTVPRMGRTRGSVSLSLAVVAAAQLLFNPLGHAQEPGPPPPPPEFQGQPPGQPGQDPNAAPYPPQGPPPVYGPIVTLRANSPRARLQVQTNLRWQDVCLTPCNVPVNPAGVYRVGGGSIRPSESFPMPRPSGPVVIDAQVGSTVKHWVGIGLTIGGIASAVAGGLYLLAGSSASNEDFGTGVSSKDTYNAAGIVYLIIGGILLAVGIPVSMSSTSVQIR